MKHIFIFSLLLVMCFLSVTFADEEPGAENLDGKDLVVRLYSDWKYSSAEFEKVTLIIRDGWVNFDANDVNDAAVVVVVADDQNDMAVNRALGNYVHKRAYTKGLRFWLPTPSNLKDKWWTFDDALGNPIPHARVEIFLANYDDSNLVFRRTRLDEQGHLKVPISSDRTTHFRLIISHLDYGIAVVVPNPYKQHKIFKLPLVKAATETEEQSIWGTVTDRQGNPVPGALIESNTLITPGGRLVTSPLGSCRMVLTDEQGRFRIRLPIEDYAIIPANSKYDVFVKAPKQIDLLNHRGRVLSGRETTIVLEQGQYLRTFVFEDANGPITDPDKLWYTCVEIACRNGRGITLTDTLYHPGWKNGKRLPLGTYYAHTTYGGKTFYFEPIEVTADSPQQLVFKPKLPDIILYQGQVVHGITGRPMPGAFIIATDRFVRNIGPITPQQWVLMHQLATEPSVDDRALEPLREICNFQKIIRTDLRGKFQMNVKSLEKHFKFVAFEEDYLPVVIEKRHVKLDENKLGQIPAMRMYPAAKVIVEPYVEQYNTEAYVKWHIDEEAHADWLSDFQSYCYRTRAFFVDAREIEKNKRQALQIPAGLNTNIKLRVRGRRGRWWCPISLGTFNASQGQTLDLGRIIFEPEMPIYIKVIDSVGNPIPGIAVAHRDIGGEDIGIIPPVTDANGIAQFTAPPYYKARFSVGYRDKRNKYISESITYETNGPEDANNVYTLQVSDEVLYQLFK